MTPTTRHALALLCAPALMACSGANDAAPPTHPTAAVADTVAPTTTVLPPPATVLSPATSPTTTEVTVSTFPPTTTLAISTEREVVAAYLLAYEAYNAAGQDPANPDRRRNVADLWSGAALEFLVSRLDEQVLNGWELRPNPEIADEVEVGEIAVRGGEAELIVCTVDPWVVVESVEGEEQIVNDAVARYRERFLLTQVDGVWRVSYSEMLQELAETELCE